MLTISCDTSRLDLERPAGRAVYAIAVLDALRAARETTIVGAEGAREADVILSLDGRFRAGHGQRTVTAISDLGHLLDRRGYGTREWVLQNWRVASAARRSHHLVVPSTAVQFGLERYLGTPARRVTVFEAHPAPGFRRRPREARPRTGAAHPPGVALAPRDGAVAHPPHGGPADLRGRSPEELRRPARIGSIG